MDKATVAELQAKLKVAKADVAKAELKCVIRMRMEGKSWQTIADILGLCKPNIHRKYAKKVDAYIEPYIRQALKDLENL